MKTPTTSHRRILAVVAAVGLVALAGIIYVLSRPDTTTAPNTTASPGLPERTVQAGAVDVTLTPLTLDTSGAVFRVTLDTHSVPLDLDMATSARLRVNDTTTDKASWDGSGPSGHHREGTLRFTTPVPTGATVELRITGLPVDATATWTAP
jgi:hypothetical protein